MWPKAWNRTIEVHAFADSDAKHRVRFELRNPHGSDNPAIEPGSPPRIPFNKEKEPRKNGSEPMKAVDWHRVLFQLVDEDDLGLRFHDDKHQALWAMTATDDVKCPTAACRHKDFHPLRGDATTLTVRNNNYSPEEIGFTLNFLRPGDSGFDPRTFVPCDPIGGNENRGTGITHQSMIGVTIGLASIATVSAAMFLQRVLKPKQPSRTARQSRPAPARPTRRATGRA
jgi:hypothetical protein